MRKIHTKTTYLEMHRPLSKPLAPPVTGIDVHRAAHLSVEQYRFLYNGVGENYQWVDRNRLLDERLRKMIEDDDVDIYVLSVAGETAGYSELDRRTPGEIELAYFGLFPQFIGRGLGKYFLSWTLETAWSYGPRRIWLHTCDLDHPAALANYQQAGFEIYDERMIDQVVPDP